MRYNEIISESRRKGSTLATMLKECSGTISNYGKGYNKLWRGFTDIWDDKDIHTIHKITPGNFPQRPAANFHYDYYEKVFDKLPSWNGIHSRAKSIICSTGEDYASDFGYPMIVIPVDNATVYELPKMDFWLTPIGDTTIDAFLGDEAQTTANIEDPTRLKYMDKMLSPKNLGVKQHTASTMKLGANHECWIGDKCYFISEARWHRLIDQGKI